MLHQIHHGWAALRIGYCGYVAFGFVEQQIDMALSSVQELAIDFNVVPLRIGFAAEFGGHLAFYGDASLRDQFFRLAPRSDACCGNNLLQTFRSHASLLYFQRLLLLLLLHPLACVADQRRLLAPSHSAESPPCPRPVV